MAKPKNVMRAFVEARQATMTPSELTAMLGAFSKPRKTSFRINTLKAPDAATHRSILDSVARRIAELHKPKRGSVYITKCPWSRTAYQLSDPSITARQLLDLDVHRQGLIHLQSLASMLPVLCFDPTPFQQQSVPHSKVHDQPAMLVLDMCAAPGGKSTQLAELLGLDSSATLILNEINAIRMPRLKQNIASLIPAALQENIHTVLCDGRKLVIRPDLHAECQKGPDTHLHVSDRIAKGVLPNLVDAILLDAPCSGEGTFSTLEPQSFANWSPAYVFKFQHLQRQLLDKAFRLLKPGGQLVYSTCTLSVEENEANIEWLIGQHPSLSVVDLALDFTDPQLSGIGKACFRPAGGPGFASAESSIPLHKALRVFPTQEYEGFFVCRLQKSLLL
ncbi:hypothetical protein BASA82_001236 [Batrachochytrium salamandrivorans]|uniref:SAM-dependent MTase RsmB/NOP-type domain-containing protein n=1 Tax=Batrachochytrium salamandrivorans TaxID=1357716 RepID=A0ABQ8F4M8_9FUNG|nr:hypothetical protein BASA60_008948 [Batrachochytrium salamandrivorans]KAH6570094.1 hypothetical protein BASA62_004491 [Batrachochytrium salamandrivorans]KAH6592093.1 hypothetical protein BASA50_008239 [Batrachochytrium salamandrivorans]KAH6599890.1 hypothetical protein BASA61_002441 [Batrachochytrium salamandrivorans]KAH9256807.1 hypothetical protein BASA81_005102 [Batrachochytrium salamandrivorans]